MIVRFCEPTQVSFSDSGYFVSKVGLERFDCVELLDDPKTREPGLSRDSRTFEQANHGPLLCSVTRNLVDRSIQITKAHFTWSSFRDIHRSSNKQTGSLSSPLFDFQNPKWRSTERFEVCSSS